MKTRSRFGGPRKQSAKASLAVLGGLILTLVVAVLGAVAFFVTKLSNQEAIDIATLCPASGPQSHLAVLLDMTDPISASQLLFVREYIEDQVDNAPVGAFVSVGIVSTEPDFQGSPTINICKPRRGQSASQFYENPGLIEEIFQDKFSDPLQLKLDQLFATETASSSPIMESIQRLISSTVGFRTSTHARSLLIMTDLMQHSPAMSFYRGEDWNSFSRSGNLERLSHALEGVTVTILRVPRINAPNESLEDFWVRYFDYQGASQVRVISVGDL
jgi:hypothetical protein